MPQLRGTEYFSNPGSLPFGAQLFFVDPNLKTPYTYQYNLSLQHQFAPTLSFEVNYLGSSSHGLTALQDINPFILGTTDRVLNLDLGNSSCPDSAAGNSGGAGCSLGALYEFRNIVDANFNAMTASLTKQTGNTPLGNIYFTLAYTWSHSIDNASGFRQRSQNVPSYEPELFRASSDTDIRNRVTFSGAWTLPFDRAWTSGPKRLTQGWSVFPIFTWRSGFPLNVFANLPNDSGSFAEGPSGAGDYLSVNANVIGPTNTFGPQMQRSVSGSSLVSCQLLPGNPNNCGNFYFNPTSFNGNQSSNNNPADPKLCTELATEPAGTFPFRHAGSALPFVADLRHVPAQLASRSGACESRFLDFEDDGVDRAAEPRNPRRLFQHPEPRGVLESGYESRSSSTFGQITNTGVPGDPRPRIIQLAARFSF